jgi:hypothetical protein
MVHEVFIEIDLRVDSGIDFGPTMALPAGL